MPQSLQLTSVWYFLKDELFPLSVDKQGEVLEWELILLTILSSTEEANMLAFFFFFFCLLLISIQGKSKYWTEINGSRRPLSKCRRSFYMFDWKKTMYVYCYLQFIFQDRELRDVLLAEQPHRSTEVPGLVRVSAGMHTGCLVMDGSLCTERHHLWDMGTEIDMLSMFLCIAYIMNFLTESCRLRFKICHGKLEMWRHFYF